MKMILMLQDSTEKITVNHLAETFGVSRRTIFRDLNSLSELNVPITWEGYSGYGVMPDYKVPPLMFTSRELATVMVGLNFVQSQVDKEMVEDARGVELKIRNVLPEQLRGFMESLSDRTVVDPFLRFGREKRDGGGWYLIANAISQQKTIRFQYRVKGGGKSEWREVDPMLLVYYEDHWNVIGYSHRRADMRNFILERMSSLDITEGNFELNRNIDIEGLIFRSDGPEYDVVLEVDNREADRLEGEIPTKIIKKERISAEIFKVCFRFDNLDFLNEWLLQFGDSVQVKAPQHLIEKREKLLKKMLAR